MENECNFCKEYHETHGFTREGHCYGCEALNDPNTEIEEGEF